MASRPKSNPCGSPRLARQAQRQLLDMQRRVLQDAIQAQLAGQDRALDRALDPAFVRGYLADHAGDGAVDALFGDESGR